MSKIVLRSITLGSVFLLFQNYSAQKSSKSNCYDLDEVLKVKPTPLYQVHLDASKKFTVALLKNNKTFAQYVNMKRLHKVKKSSTGYRLQKLTHSREYLNFKTRKTLERIGSRFYEDTKGSYFTVTSLTRTLEDQCQLRKVNRNASSGISSHNYGNSFDISYIRFNGKMAHNEKLLKKLESVLEHYRKLGRIYYIKEKQQSCFHITVRNY